MRELCTSDCGLLFALGGSNFEWQSTPCETIKIRSEGRVVSPSLRISRVKREDETLGDGGLLYSRCCQPR